MSTTRNVVAMPKGPYRVINVRQEKLVYPTVKLSRETLDSIETRKTLAPRGRREPWKEKRRLHFMVAWWVKGERAPRWFRAEIV